MAIKVRETNGSLATHRKIVQLLSFLDLGPLTAPDMQCVQEWAAETVRNISVPCSRFLQPYDVNGCGVCDGGRCCDYEVKYYEGLPHIYYYYSTED